MVLHVRRCCCAQARLVRHPCPTWSLRLHAAAIAAAIRNVSEAGRLYGHVRRALPCDSGTSSGHVGNGGGLMRLAGLYGKRFDWFCGLDQGIVRMEQLRAAARAGVHWTTAVWALSRDLGCGRSCTQQGAAWACRWLTAVLAIVWTAAVSVVMWRE
jgi:hypothetical protein